MQPLHRSPPIRLIPQNIPRQPKVVSIIRISLCIQHIHRRPITPITLIIVLKLHCHIKQLQLGGIVDLIGQIAREAVSVEFEGEEVGHTAEFGRNVAVEAVSVEGEVLEETEFTDFGWNFTNQVVANCGIGAFEAIRWSDKMMTE